MGIIEQFLLALALSIDACVVSFTYGITQREKVLKASFLLALFTGAFQGLMPLLGGLCTHCVRNYIEPFSKWIVFIIFMYLGINFIKEAFEKEKQTKELSYKVLFLIAIATSIDAFSAGIPLCLNCSNLYCPIVLITIVTFINSLIGFQCGRVFTNFKPKYLEIIGGAILILLAIKVVL